MRGAKTDRRLKLNGEEENMAVGRLNFSEEDNIRKVEWSMIAEGRIMVLGKSPSLGGGVNMEETGPMECILGLGS